jgi:hypothetical protein
LAALVNATATGSGELTLGTVAPTTLKTFNASANTGGVTATINANAGTMTAMGTAGYIFSQGDDVVTLNDETVSIDVALGAGDDKVTLAAYTAGTTVSTGKTVDGGEGTNTIAMNDQTAAAMSSSFTDKFTNFDKLQLTEAVVLTNTGVVGGTAQDIVLDMDTFGMDYIITAGTTPATTPATTPSTPADVFKITNMASNGT